jgi:hypothetical protein
METLIIVAEGVEQRSVNHPSKKFSVRRRCLHILLPKLVMATFLRVPVSRVENSIYQQETASALFIPFTPRDPSHSHLIRHPIELLDSDVTSLLVTIRDTNGMYTSVQEGESR